MPLTVIPIAGLLAIFLVAAQDDPPAGRGSQGRRGASRAMASGREASRVEIRQAIEAEVEAERLDVFDQARGPGVRHGTGSPG